MTRLAVAAAAFLALFAIVTQEASALTATTRQCIARERRAYRDALRAARASELNTFNQKYQSCFGPGATCAQACQLQQTVCQKPAKDAQQKCIEDNDPATGKDDPNFTSCGDTFESAIAACNALQDDAAALQCAANARLARFTCTQQCAAAQAGALDVCNFQFGDCVQACASQPIQR
jgi:hypothetical protein